MVNSADALWLSVNPSLSQFDQRLCRQLNRQVQVECWSYHQTADEPCCLQVALGLLWEHMDQQPPLHLIGHGLSGVLGLLYSRLRPERVASLTLLSVAADPAVDWPAHYYVLRQFLPCDREAILIQMGRLLFGYQGQAQAAAQAAQLARVLDTELASHSLAQRSCFIQGGITPPLLACFGEQDAVVDLKSQEQWRPWLKPSDRLWRCPKGRHFFHHEQPQLVGQQILDFWQHTAGLKSLPLIELRP